MKKLCYLLLFLCFRFTSPSQFLSKARWITSSFPENSLHPGCPVFKKEFTLSKQARSATLYITCHGLYEAWLNGRRIGNAYFTPGYTSYDKRLQYQVYDLTKQLKHHDTLRVTIADGWWRGIYGGWMKNNNYGTDASLLCELRIEFTDGSKHVILSDASWQSASGPILSSGIYQGEMTDNRIQPHAWMPVIEKESTKKTLVPTTGEPVTKQETFKPVSIKNSIIDFGQNLTGWVEVKINGKAGDTIKITHAETLDKDENFYTGNLREAKAVDIYILKQGLQTLEPHFTYHGFRYAKVEGFTPTKDNCLAIAVHSNLEHTGSFSCSNPLINQLQHNIEWSLNGNFLDIPTDCPQRSERLGWAGDAQVFCRTAAFNRNTKNFFAKWLADLAADQGINGAVPVIIPDIYGHSNKDPKRGVAGWGDAATIIPWTMYEVFGDRATLLRQYESMKCWVEYIRSVSPGLLWKANGYGDWYAQGPSTSLPLIDQCFFAYSTSLVVKAATVLHQQGDLAYYSTLLKNSKTIFLNTYEDSLITQTACILALQFDLLPDSLRARTAKKLVDLIHQNNDHLATGFLGTPYLLNVLTRFGYTGLAFTLLNQTTMPSWLYPITKGATTIWEKWDAIRPDGSFDTCSLNHYAYGAVGDWLYQEVAGIQAAAPGYQKIIIKPHIGGGLTWAKASYKSKYGLIISSWKIESGMFKMFVRIPADTSAIVCLPNGVHKKIIQGSHRFMTRLI